jgi:hypothetical protein
MENLKEKLNSEKETTSWKMLEEHHNREALLIVGNSLDLIDTGIAIANDEVNDVKNWLTSGELKRADDEMIKDYEENEDIKFEFIIIQPYVLAKRLEE